MTNMNNLYWSLAQKIAHHTITGVPMRVGSLIGTGCVSGFEPYSFCSLLEWKKVGNRPSFVNGESREYLLDGDEVIIRGYATGEEFNIGFGELRNAIIPAVL